VTTTERWADLQTLMPPIEDDVDAPGASWAPLALTAVVDGLHDGTLTCLAPTVGLRDDGHGLFYPGRVNGLFGESGDGKTWVALACGVQELRCGRHVVLLDFEDIAPGIVQRLIDLGATDEEIIQRFHYVWPSEPFGFEAETRLAKVIANTFPSLAVVDSTGEAMSLDHVNPNATDEVARWSRRLPGSLARQGLAVVTLDHVTKAKDGRGLYAIGSQRKRAAVTGASYLVDATAEFGKGMRGIATLTTAKDRLGNYVRGRVAAEFVLDATSAPYVATLRRAPDKLDASGEGFRPSRLMEKISRYVEGNPDISMRSIRTAVGGKVTYVDLAIELLVREGYVETKPGPNRASLHRSVKPFRDDEESE